METERDSAFRPSKKSFQQMSHREDRATVQWRRLDLPGHEVAQLSREADGWRLSGVAAVAESGRPCRLEYDITSDAKWHTERCLVHGYVGLIAIKLDLVRSPSSAWTVNGAPVGSLDGCEDVDLGFSPATNLLPIRRLRLDVGATASVRAAWVRFPEMTTELLEQVYTRVAADRYLYESAGGTFKRELIVDATGFVVEYPGVWVAEASAGTVDVR